MLGYQSGQMVMTVNHASQDFIGSTPIPSTERSEVPS